MFDMREYMQLTEKYNVSILTTLTHVKRFAGASLIALGLVACGDSGDTGAEVDGATYKFEVFDHDLIVGDPDAPITIVEYSSMTCPHCAHFHETVYPTMREKYLDTGQAKLIFRHYPLDGIAAQASLMIACSTKDRQIKLIDALFARQSVWLYDQENPMMGLNKILKQASFTDEAINECSKDKTNAQNLQQNMDDGQNVYEITGTPSFFVNGAKVRMTTVADLDRIMADLVPSAEPTAEESSE